MPEGIHIGAAEEDIVPPFTMVMGGNATRGNRHFEGVIDVLSAGALSFRQGERRIIIIRMDLSALADEVMEAVSKKLEDKYRISPDAVLFNVSHTHSAPLGRPMDSILFTDGDQALYKKFIGFLEKKLLEICDVAVRDEEPCSMFFAKTSSDFGINRRKKIGNEVKSGPEINGFYDKDLSLIIIKNEKGDIKSILFSYACHPVVMGSWNFKLSADFPGYAGKYLRENSGASSVFFLQGCCGNIRPRVLAEGDYWRKGTLNDLETQGRKMGQAMLEAIDGNLEKLHPDIASAKKVIPLKYERKMSIEDYRMELEDPENNSIKKNWAARMINCMNNDATFEVREPFIIQKIQLSSNTCIIAMSGEVVAEIGREIKDMAPDMNIITLGYMNAAYYVPTGEMFPEKGYEVESYYHFSLSGKVSPEMGDMIVNSCRELLTQPAVDRL
ncbi:MAG: hypothetical protein A2017_02950 [Lentisphaerae bacterium GWF2_44_16]|nr:MAG: hypothetical protein A2017_02950 [Lentisphaerae bacterium GWF2_44_16]